MFYKIKSESIFKASKVEGCRMVRQTDLGFDFQYGSCNSFMQPAPKILLCFHYFDVKACHS